MYLYNKFCSHYLSDLSIESMMTRIRDGNSGQVIGAGGNNSLSNPFAPTSMKIDEDEMDFIPFEHTQFSQDNLKSMSMLIILFERYF